MIFHLATVDEWHSEGVYEPESLTTEGFIHCSTASQLLDVANSLFHGRHDLMLLTIEPDLLSAPVVFEDCYDAGERFPHVYGRLDPEAIIDQRPFRPGPDGTFAWDVD